MMGILLIQKSYKECYVFSYPKIWHMIILKQKGVIVIEQPSKTLSLVDIQNEGDLSKNHLFFEEYRVRINRYSGIQ